LLNKINQHSTAQDALLQGMIEVRNN